MKETTGQGETEFARKQEERARRRAVAEAAQKKKVDQQKQFAQVRTKLPFRAGIALRTWYFSESQLGFVILLRRQLVVLLI